MTACRESASTTYEGLPEGVKTTCSWGMFKVAKGDCNAGGKRYTCIREELQDDSRYWTHVSCRPYSLPGAELQLHTTEKPEGENEVERFKRKLRLFNR